MLKIKCSWNTREYKMKHTGVKVARRCSNFSEETMIDLDIMNITYQNIITTFVLNKMLNHVGMSWIIENNEELQYDIDEQNSDWMT